MHTDIIPAEGAVSPVFVASLVDQAMMRLTDALKDATKDLVQELASKAATEALSTFQQLPDVDAAIRDAFTGLTISEAAVLASRLSVTINAAVLASLGEERETEESSSGLPPPPPPGLPPRLPLTAAMAKRLAPREVVPEKRRAATSPASRSSRSDLERAWVAVREGKSWSEIIAMGICAKATLSTMQKIRTHIGAEAASRMNWMEAKRHRAAAEGYSEDATTERPEEDNDSPPWDANTADVGETSK